MLPTNRRTQLEKLQLFEELDRRLMERVGVHLADVGDLSSPALAKILRDTADVSPAASSSSAFHQERRQHLAYPAPSPAAAAAAPAAGTPGSLSYSDGGSSGDGTPSVGIDLSNSASPAASLTSILSGGPIEPSSYGRGRKASQGGGAAAAVTAEEDAAGLQTSPYLDSFASVQDDDDAQSAAASGSEVSPAPSAVSSGVSSVTTINRGMSPVTVGDGGGNRGRTSPGALSYSNSLASSPLSLQPYAFDSSSGGGVKKTSSGDKPPLAASVEVSADRGWVSSPINAKHVAAASDKDERAPAFALSGDSSGGAFRSGGGRDARENGERGSGGNPGVEGGAGGAAAGTVPTHGGGGSTDGNTGSGEGPPPPQQQQQRQPSADFDENAFAEQEQRMRHAFLMRLGSVDSEASSGGRQGGGAPARDHDGSLTSLSMTGGGSGERQAHNFQPADSLNRK